jgi:hypothetical protein
VDVKVLVPAGILGYSYRVEAFEIGLEMKPDVIAVDGGSLDPGPFYLGEGESFLPRLACKMDLEPMILGGKRLGVPVIVTSAGGSGARPHVEFLRRIVEEIAMENGLDLKISLIFADIDKAFLRRQVEAGRTMPFGHDSPLDLDDLDRTPHIVGQMAHEPIVEALRGSPDVILTGRALDISAMAAFPIFKGIDPALACHMGQILECGSRAIVRAQGRRTPVMGICTRDSFRIEPVDPASQATVESISTHMLYEERDPVLLEMPGGAIDATECVFAQLDPRIVEVSNTKFIKSEKYHVKLEGATEVGYRCMMIGGTRSEAMVRQIDDCMERAFGMTREHFTNVEPSRFQIYNRIYGKNGVMGDWEPQKVITSHELGILTEVVAESQDLADAICHYFSGTILHHMDYPGNLSHGGGNMAYASSPLEIGRGRVYELRINHLVEMTNPLEHFPIETLTVQGSSRPTEAVGAR